MERLLDMGLVRSIGMSNMTITKLEQILPLCRIRPTVLEVEMNPTFSSRNFLNTVKRMIFFQSLSANGITVQA